MKENFILLSYDEAKLLQDTKGSIYDINLGISGIYFSNNNEIVSTDARRLVIIKKEIPIKLKEKVINFEIQLKKNCNVKIDDKFIELIPEKRTGKSREKLFPKYDLKFIDVKYPNYKSVIPDDKESYYEITLNSDYIPKGFSIKMNFQESNVQSVKCELKKKSKKIADYILMPIR